MNKSQLINNFLAQTYHSLRESDRFIQERGTKSYFELFWDMMNNAFSLGLKGYHPPNSTVESFYRGTLDVQEFCLQVRETIVDKNHDKLDANIDPLLTISWDIYSSISSRKRLCESIPKLCRRQIWGIFNRFDSDNTGFSMIDDIVEVIGKIYRANGQEESEDNIREWFCDQQKIDFWSFFSALVETHSDLLTPSILQAVYDEIFFEILKEGKMKKKGHKVANWKERWFVLSTTQMCYYESQENRSLKGTIIINKSSKVEKLNPTKDHPYLFRITCGKSGIRYDLSAHDPQIMCDWIEIMQIAVGTHSENGYSMLHKLRQSRLRLFPHYVQSKGLPTYKQGGHSEYNEGVYRVVGPSSKHPKVTSPKSSITDPIPPRPFSPTTTVESRKETSPTPMTSSQSSSPLSPSPTYEAVSGPKIKPYRSEGSIIMLHAPSPPPSPDDDDVMSNHTYVNVSNPRDTVPNLDLYNNSSDIGSMSPSPPPVIIKQQYADSHKQNDGYINVQHINNDGKDYAIVDKKESPPPLGDNFTDDHVYVNVQKGNAGGTSTLDGKDLARESSNTVVQGRTAPIPKKRAVKPSKSVPPTIPSTSPTKQPPASNLPVVKSGDKLDYTLLDFDDSTDPEQPPGKQMTSNPKPKSQVIAETKFDYCEVLLPDESGTNAKDIDKAQQLKANRPPPTPPAKYNPKQNDVSQPPPTPPDRQESQTKSVRQNNDLMYSSSPPNGVNDEEPPPPPPRRVGASSKPKETPPVPPPRR